MLPLTNVMSVWVLHQQRKVPCKNGRCMATSEVAFYPDPSPVLLTPPPTQCKKFQQLHNHCNITNIMLWWWQTWNMAKLCAKAGNAIFQITLSNGRRPSLPKPIKNTNVSLQYGLGEIIFLAEFAWCVKSKVHNSNSSSSASRNFLTSIKQVISSSILPK